MCRKWIYLLCLFMLLGLPQTSVVNAADDSLIGWWKLDETSGTIAQNSSGNGYDGTLQGNPQWTAGQIGGALAFDGTDDYVDLPIGSLISSLTDSTFAAWVNWSGQGGDWQRIFDFGSGTSVNMFLTPSNGYTGTPRFVITFAGWQYEDQINTSEVLSTGWHHVAVTIDLGSTTDTLYINGQAVGQNTATRNTPSNLGETTQNWLGRSQYASDPYYNGSLDEFRIYNRVLSQAEIQQIMRGELNPFASDPDPGDGAIRTDTSVTLSWTPAAGAVSHDVYFGTDYDAVANAVTTDVTGIYRGRQNNVIYTPLEALEWGQTYYWRIDEVGPDGMIYMGAVWSFTVTPEEGWVPFIPGAEPGTLHEVKLKASDNTGITVDSNIPGMYSANVCAEDYVCQRLSIPDAGRATEIGKPEVPMIRRYFEVPYDVNLTLEVVYLHAITLEGYNVCPAQPPLYETDEIPEYVIDSNTYSTDAFYPPHNAFVEEPIIIRGHRIVSLTLCPVQFNPVTKQLRVYSKIEGRLNYDRPAQIEGVEKRLESEAFESLCKAFILNYKSPEEYLSRRHKDVGSPSVDYLIITHDDFNPNVKPLADWKEKKGLRTKIVKTSDISSPAAPTTADITDYIQDAYDTWNPPPTYVLLVGDSEFIPTHYVTAHPSPAHGGHRTATDLYYGTLDGDDRYPDVFVGRISVDTAADANTIVNKIIGYEQSPPTDANFYNDISLCAYFQDDADDGQEDRNYVFTTEQILDYLNGQGYNAERIYNTNGTNPTNYSNGTAVTGGINWNGTPADITGAFNNGRLLITHRDHGLSRNFWNERPVPHGQWQGTYDGWSEPWFTTWDVPWLNNGNAFPVVFSINCQTGWFDGETDPYTWNFECYCEELLRHQNGGAVAVFGATRNSPTACNDYLFRGFTDAILPDFLSPTQNALYRLGQVLTYGKIIVVLQNGYSDDSTIVEVEEYNLFGDPEMSLWTNQPQPLTVIHPSKIGSGGSQKFVAKVTDGANPVLHALVCLRKDTDVHTFEYTDAGGHVIFDITPSTGGNLDITVTKHNYLPYEEVIEVTNGGAVITELLPDSAVPLQPFRIIGKNFSNGEEVDTYFDATGLYLNEAVDGDVNFVQSVPSPYPEGPSNVTVIGRSSGRAAVAVLTVFPPEPLPEPYIYSQDSSMTWHLNPSGGDPVWDNPCIRLYEESTGNHVSRLELQIGTTYTIKAEIHNSANLPANGTEVTFKSSPFGIGQPWEFIGTDTVDVPAATGTIQASVNWTPILTGHRCIRVEIWHPLDSYFRNNWGYENCRVEAITSPAEIFFDVRNPTDTPALVYLEATQSDPCEQGELWGTRIEREYPQVLEPGEHQTVTLTILAPEWAEIGESRTVSVTGTINGEIIGGIEIQVIKDHPPILTNGYVDPNSGVTGTNFTYWVKYTDEDNHPPMKGYPTLTIFKGGVPVSGSPFVMDEEYPNDAGYADGKIYTYSITLSEPGDDYTYCFWARDSLGIGAEGPAADVMSGPLVVGIGPK